MPRVDFYILSGHQPVDRFICQLTAKIWQQGHQLTIQTPDQEQAAHLDERLWTFSDISFIPHTVVDKNASPKTPILITWEELVENGHDVLINLSGKIPEHVAGFTRIVEIVTDDEQTKQVARDRFRYYRDQGYELESHTIN